LRQDKTSQIPNKNNYYVVCVAREELERAGSKYPQTKIEMYYTRKFSNTSLFDTNYPLILTLVLLFPFLFSLYSSVAKPIPHITVVSCSFYIVIATTLGILSLFLFYKRKKRIRNICKELNITTKKYHHLILKYYFSDLYKPTLKEELEDFIE